MSRFEALRIKRSPCRCLTDDIPLQTELVMWLVFVKKCIVQAIYKLYVNEREYVKGKFIDK